MPSEITYENQSEYAARSKSGGGKKGHSCPICGGGSGSSWSCGPSEGDTPGAVNCSIEIGQKWQEIDGYKCISPMGANGVSIWIPAELSRYNNGSKLSPEEIQTRKERTAELERQRKAELAAKKIPAKIVYGRDAHYRNLSAQSGLDRVSAISMQNNVDRGMDRYLPEMIESGACIPVTPEMREAGICNIWADKNDSGMLWVIRALNTQAVGAIFRGDHYENGAKYIHNSNARFPGYDESGKMPIHHIPGGNPNGLILIIEGVAKAEYFARICDMSEIAMIMGVGSCSAFPGAVAAILAVAEEHGHGEVAIVPDAGSFANPNVLNAYNELAMSPELAEAGITVKIADFGYNFDKSGLDPDELPEGTKISDYVTTFAPKLGWTPTFINGEVKFQQLATQIRQIRTVNARALAKTLKEKNAPIFCSSRADDKGGIFIPHAREFRGFYASFYGEEGNKQRALLGVTQSMFEAKGSEWMVNELGLKLKLDSGVVTTVGQHIEHLAQAKAFDYTTSTKYLSDAPEFQATFEKLIRGDRAAVILGIGYGGGKTTAAKKIAEHVQNVAFIVPTISLANTLSLEMSSNHRKFYTHFEAAGKSKVRDLITTFASFNQGGHLKGVDWAEGTMFKTFAQMGIIFFDEFQKVLDEALNESILKKDRGARLKQLVKTIQEANKIIIADANLFSYSIEFLKTIRPEFVSFTNQAKPKQSDLFVLDSADAAMAELFSQIDNLAANGGKRIAVNLDIAFAQERKLAAETIREYAIKAGLTDRQVMLIDSRTQSSTDDKDYKASVEIEDHILLVIYTPCWQEGISIEEKYEFGAVFGFYYGNMNVNAAGQGLHRVRHDCDRYIYCENKSRTRRQTLEEVEAVGAAITEAAYDILDDHMEIHGEEAPIDLVNSIEKIAIQSASPAVGSSPLAKYLQTSIPKNNASADNFKIELIAHLQWMGYTLKTLSHTRTEGDIARAEMKTLSKAKADSDLDETVAGEELTQAQGEAIQKGGHATRAQIMAFEKWEFANITKGSVCIQEREELREAKKHGAKKIIRVIRSLYGTPEESLMDRTTIATKQNHEDNYTAENNTLREAEVEARLRKLGITDKVIDLLKLSIEGGWFNKDHPIFKDILKTIMGDKILMSLMGLKRSNDRRQWGKNVTAVFKFLGFTVTSKRDKHGFNYSLSVPVFAQRIILWRIENPGFEHNKESMQLPKITAEQTEGHLPT